MSVALQSFPETIAPTLLKKDGVGIGPLLPEDTGAMFVWTNDIDRGHYVSRQLNAGTVWINTYGPTDARLPWGGMGGQSGIGRDLGRTALENYTEQKTVWLQMRPRPDIGAAA